ncbi:DUF499 domain-containing protein [Halorubrum ejinorense]|uniref:DUF499 domain-containing protein n=1 Tax=Halorubrum ejinorense TaxID=425309 RepID=A0AAV3SSB4_9EURY
MTKTISDFVEPSDEIQAEDGSISADGLLDEVSLYNLYDERDSPEQDAERILDITYPTETLKAIIQNAVNKLDSSSDLTEGTHVIGGEFGSGKSHIELVVYHLLNSPKLGQKWLNSCGIDVTLPDETRTAALQMFNLEQEYDRLSEAVGDYLGVDEWADDSDLPTVHDIRDTLDGKPTVVLIDEFERWFGMANRSEYKDDNLAFLQNLLEAAGRDDTQLCVFVSLLYESDDVQAITQRTNPFTYDLSSRRDEKIEFILHRLVGERLDAEGISDLAREYTDVYRQNDQIQLDDYHDMQQRIDDFYPFHPAMLTLLMDKYSEQRISSDARGLLKFLTEILKDNFESVNLVLTGDVNVHSYVNRFQYIDSELVGKYTNDYYRVQNADDSFDDHVEELLNITLLYSLARGGESGANKRQMLMGSMRKEMNAHEIIQTFQEKVYGTAWHIHRLNGEYAFDTDENPTARINKKAEDIHKHDAIHRIESLVKDDLFDGHNSVFILDPVNTERDIPDNKNLKIVVSLAAKRNYDDDFKMLTTEAEREWNNTLVLVTPEKRSSIDSNTGIIELARKVVSGEQLKREESTLPADFDDIHEQNFQNLRDRVRDKFGTVHTSTDRGLFPQDLSVSGNADFYSATLEVVRPDSSQLRNEVSEAVENAGESGIQYQYLRNDFYRTMSYTTLTEEGDLQDAIKSLCRDGEIQVGSYFEETPRTIGSDTELVHESFIEEEEGEEPRTITAVGTKTKSVSSGVTSQSASESGSTSAVEEDESGSSGSVSREVSVFECPQCGEELSGSECDNCGFEVSASEVEDGSVTVEGASTEDLLTQLGDETEGGEDSGPNVRPHPPMGTMAERTIPDLIDRVDREIKLDWSIHSVDLVVTGSLGGDDVGQFGLSEEYADSVEIDETFSVEPDEPMRKTDLTNFLMDLVVPENASVELSLKVVKDGES